MPEATLRDTILRIGEEANAAAVAVAAYDFEHHTTWSLNASRWFHAASTIKVPVLLAVSRRSSSTASRPSRACTCATASSVLWTASPTAWDPSATRMRPCMPPSAACSPCTNWPST
ncbi:serine hydrolase [Ramlibacter montanisoli]|uniref:serine hydrolase n=1 Tax=Ramlibacter montanisoli TaxID=2732512 RepID=UPI0035A08549